MPTVRDYNRKLVQLKNSRKMTKTMKMVAASKLRKAHEIMSHVADFCAKASRDLGIVIAQTGPLDHPLCRYQKRSKKALVLLITTDRGLCGGFNNNLNRKTLAWVNENSSKYDRISVSFCGRRGYRYLKSKVNIGTHYEGIGGKLKFADVARIAEEFKEEFINGEYDEVFIARNKFKSAISQTPVIERFLPMDPAGFKPAGSAATGSVTVEPDADGLIDFIVSNIVALRLYSAFAENAVGENAARMAAMDMATSNAEKLLDTYTLLRNHARQAAITRELIEIVSGAEALA